tara:strand:+ start:905 stop:1246 length:342 start_codon:yes stop_codon:yes gene_type:complete
MPTKLWKKGESGNPNGRPKGSISVVSALKRELAKVPEGEKKTYLELLVKRIMKKGIVDGDVSMIKDIINRVDGMPKENVDITFEERIPLLGGDSNKYKDGNKDKGDQQTSKSS